MWIQKLTLVILLAAFALLGKLLSPYFFGEQIAADTLKIIVPALLVVIGWLVTFLLQEYRHQRERTERRTDLKLALRAEIWDFHKTFVRADTVAFGKMLEEKILQAGDGKDSYRPFIPQEKNTTVFAALVSRIDQLPPETVDEVVQFYSQVEDLTIFARDLRSEAFAQLPAQRRAMAYRDYIEMKVEANARAIAAIRRLNASLGIDLDDVSADLQAEKQQVRDWLNSQVADHHDH